MSSPPNDFAVLLTVDAILIKASGGSRDLLFQNMEQRLYGVLLRRWQSFASKAVRRGVLVYNAGSMYGAVDEKAISAAVGNAFKDWEQGARDDIEAVTRDAYLEGKQAVLDHVLAQWGVKSTQKANGEAEFTLRDEKAIGKLVDDQLHWVGEFYDAEMSQSIDDIIRNTMLETGLGRAAAAKLLEAELAKRLVSSGVQMPAGFVNKPGAYFEVIAANTASNARVRGSLGQMVEIGVDKYTISIAGDERTCSRCKHMDGKTITVKHAAQVMSDIDAASTPEEVKRLHPWANKLSEIEANPDRFPFPPYHGACRCTVDVASDAEISFESLHQEPQEDPNTAILNQKVTRTRNLGGGVNESKIIKFADGNAAVWKPSTGESTFDLPEGIAPRTMHKREAATHAVATRVLGLDVVPSTIVRTHEGVEGSAQLFVKAKPSWKATTYERESAEQMRLLDFVSGNRDRHVGNVLLDNGRVVAIDNGQAFPSVRAGIQQPVAGSLPYTGKGLLKTTKDRISNLDLDGLAQTLHNSGIDKESIRHSLFRAILLKEQPSVLEVPLNINVAGNSYEFSKMTWDRQQNVFSDISLTAESKVSAAGRARIDQIMSSL